MNTVYVDDGTPKFITLNEHLAQKKSYCLMSWDETGVVFFSSESGWGALSEETDLYGQPFQTFVVPPLAGQPVKWIELEEAEALVQIEMGCDEDLAWRDEVAEWRAQGEREEQWDNEESDYENLFGSVSDPRPYDG